MDRGTSWSRTHLSRLLELPSLGRGLAVCACAVNAGVTQEHICVAGSELGLAVDWSDLGRDVTVYTWC